MSANNEGHGSHGSRLQNWIEHELLHLAMHKEKEDLGPEIPDRSLSLRIPVTTHVMLQRIAYSLGRSKTACAEEILNTAVRDVYQQFGLSPLTQADLEEHVAQTERAGDKRP